MSNGDGKSRHKAAIIGCGPIAGGYDRFSDGKWTSTHAGAYRLCPRTELLAAVDIDRQALSAFAKRWCVERTYSDYREMLDRERPDIVSVCLPTEGHHDAFQACCAAGARAIFLEKPVATSIEEAVEMPALASGRLVAVNYFRRWNPSLQKLKEELESGELGRPIRVIVHYVKGLVGNASHYVDLLRWFFGEPEGVRALRAFERPGEEPAADFEMAFPEGLVATFLHLPEPGYVFLEVDLFTESGRVVLAQRAQQIFRFPLVEEPHFRRFSIVDHSAEAVETQWRDCTFRAVEELIDCLEEGGGRPACSLEDGIRALAICRTIKTAAPSTDWITV